MNKINKYMNILYEYKKGYTRMYIFEYTGAF